MQIAWGASLHLSARSTLTLRKCPGPRASDDLDIESLMLHLNASKVYSKRFDINKPGWYEISPGDLRSSPAAKDQTQAKDNEDDGPVHLQVEIDRVAKKQAHGQQKHEQTDQCGYHHTQFK